MFKSAQEIYNKGYNDGFEDALNNLDLEDLLAHISPLSRKEKQSLLKNIKEEIDNE